jgi:hypothetical protein
MAVLVFMVGLVSEQVTQLRFDRSEMFSGCRGVNSPTGSSDE